MAPLTESADHDIDAGDGAAHTDGARDGAGEPPATVGRLARRARAYAGWFVVVGGALVVALLVRTFVVGQFVVEGTSMYATLDSGDRVLVDKLSYRSTTRAAVTSSSSTTPSEPSGS